TQGSCTLCNTGRGNIQPSQFVMAKFPETRRAADGADLGHVFISRTIRGKVYAETVALEIGGIWGHFFFISVLLRAFLKERAPPNPPTFDECMEHLRKHIDSNKASFAGAFNPLEAYAKALVLEFAEDATKPIGLQGRTVA